MAYRFQSTQQPAPAIPSNYGSGGHRIANTLMMVRQAMDRRKRLEFEKEQEEEARRQFGVQAGMDRRKLAAQMEDWEAKRAQAAEQMQLEQDKFGLNKDKFASKQALTGAELYEKQQALDQANRPDDATVLSGIGARMPMMKQLAPAVVARAEVEEAARRADEQKSGLELVDEALASDPNAPPDETPEYSRAVQDVSSALAPMLEMGNEDEKAGAAMAMKEIPGLLEAYSGDMEKARDEAVKAANKHADRLQSERRSKRNARAARGGGGGGGPKFDAKEYRRGVQTAKDFAKMSDVNMYVDDLKTLGEAKRLLTSDKFKDNPSLVGSQFLQVMQRISGQSGHAFSNRDLQETMGKSWWAQMQDWVETGLVGQAGEAKRKQLVNALEGALSSSKSRVQGAYDVISSQTSSTGAPEGGDFERGVQSGLAIFNPVMGYIERREEGKGGGDGTSEAKAKTKKLSDKAIDELNEDDIANMSVEELEAALGGS